MAVKFNDYFEFPREFDIYPYTAAGLAKIEGTVQLRYYNAFLISKCCCTKSCALWFILISEGETIPDTSKDEDDVKEDQDNEVNEKDDISIGTLYKLRGVLVHSGQASGGHYYSFMHLK